MVVLGWFDRKRENRLKSLGHTITRAELLAGMSPPPRQLLSVKLSARYEPWVVFRDTVHFDRHDRYVLNGKLILDAGDPKLLAETLGLPYQVMQVRF